MLTDQQLISMAEHMNIPLECVSFKNELPTPLKFNKSYIINMQDELDERGQPNEGSHWCAFQIQKDLAGDIRPIYFDPFGVGPPLEVSKAVEKFCNKKLPYTSKDVQNLMSFCCGWYSLAICHWWNSPRYSCGNIYVDTDNFLDMFLDLNVSTEWKQNEFILKHFFRSDDPAERLPIEISEDITKF